MSVFVFSLRLEPSNKIKRRGIWLVSLLEDCARHAIGIPGDCATLILYHRSQTDVPSGFPPRWKSQHVPIVFRRRWTSTWSRLAGISTGSDFGRRRPCGLLGFYTKLNLRSWQDEDGTERPVCVGDQAAWTNLLYVFQIKIPSWCEDIAYGSGFCHLLLQFYFFPWQSSLWFAREKIRLTSIIILYNQRLSNKHIPTQPTNNNSHQRISHERNPQ